MPSPGLLLKAEVEEQGLGHHTYAGGVRPPVLAEVLRGSLPAFVQNWSCVVGFMVSPGTDCLDPATKPQT